MTNNVNSESPIALADMSLLIPISVFSFYY